MPQIQEAEYKRLPGVSLHRWLSLIILIVWEGVDWQLHSQLFFFRQRCLLIFPLACIWFADELAERAALLFGASSGAEANPRVVRWGGWTVLLLGMSLFSFVIASPPLPDAPPENSPVASPVEAPGKPLPKSHPASAPEPRRMHPY